MNINPDARTVLCFGDSNTYGQRAEDVDRGRWPIDVRWTGLLQRLLGDGYSVVEEGLNGRTIDLDEQRPGRNGRTYLIPCLESQHGRSALGSWAVRAATAGVHGGPSPVNLPLVQQPSPAVAGIRLDPAAHGSVRAPSSVALACCRDRIDRPGA